MPQYGAPKKGAVLSRPQFVWKHGYGCGSVETELNWEAWSIVHRAWTGVLPHPYPEAFVTIPGRKSLNNGYVFIRTYIHVYTINIYTHIHLHLHLHLHLHIHIHIHIHVHMNGWIDSSLYTLYLLLYLHEQLGLVNGLEFGPTGL